MDYTMFRVKKAQRKSNRKYLHVHYCFISETLMVGGVRFRIDAEMIPLPELLVREIAQYFEKRREEGEHVLDDDHTFVESITELLAVHL
jgi:hypothetical protein